jgi:hydroxymethylpyrimidine/phosphomethylpyrimidine kinase
VGTSRRIRCLTIGSSDSSGGAGIQGDIKAMAALGAYGASVLVGVTAQNTHGVRQRHSVPPDFVAAQLDAVLDDIRIDAVKVGTTWSVEIIELIAARLSQLSVPIVIDPVLGTASGTQLGGGAAAIDVVRRRFFPVATVVTPNLREARMLAGQPEEHDPAKLAETLVGLGARAVLITDALAAKGEGDWLFDGQQHRRIAGERHDTGCEHGAGCAHSSMLAVLLASGVPLLDAAREVRRLAGAAVAHGVPEVGTGVHPVDILAGVRAVQASGSR